MFPRHEILGSGLSQDSKRPPGPLLVAHFLAHTLLADGKDLSRRPGIPRVEVPSGLRFPHSSFRRRLMIRQGLRRA